MRWTGHLGHKGEDRCTEKYFLGTSEGKRVTWTPLRRWENNINKDITEIKWEIVEWLIWIRIGIDWGLLGTRKSRWETTSFSTLFHGFILGSSCVGSAVTSYNFWRHSHAELWNETRLSRAKCVSWSSPIIKGLSDVTQILTATSLYGWRMNFLHSCVAFETSSSIHTPLGSVRNLHPGPHPSVIVFSRELTAFYVRIMYYIY
jgi:hypothetical protein